MSPKSKLMRPLWPESVDLGTPLDEASRMWYLLLAGMVQRYHSVPTITTDTVGEHTFGVVWLCALMSDGIPRAELLLAALWHDVPELTIGDMPAPAKRRLGLNNQFIQMEKEVLGGLLRLPALELTDDEKRTLTIADRVDGMLHCCYERALGNQVIEEVYDRFVIYVAQLNPSEPEQKVIDAVTQIWSAYHGH